jgi:hypothetical protein
MKTLLAVLLLGIFAIGVWSTHIARSPLPLVLPRGIESHVAYALQNEATDPHWVTGTIRHIDPASGTVLLQTEQGPRELFAPPVVLLGLTEGKTVSVYVAADELAATIET